MLDSAPAAVETVAMVGNVTRVLEAMQTGDATPDELIALVYEELRRVAGRQLSREQPGHTLQTTALVHEAYLRLFGGEEQSWENRRHFFSAAAEAMRRILIEKAREKSAQKRGGRMWRRELSENNVAEQAPPEELLAINEALDRLAALDGEAASLVKLRYFGGLTIPEVANVLGIPHRSADRLWAFAKAWLLKQMRDDGGQHLP
jgi:RNA polymerase sigma factor (TIGR02999 family)